VLDLCRALVAAGHDPATPLRAYRGAVLCLMVRSIGEAAKLRASSRGVGFERLAPPTVSEASPIAQKRRAVGRAA
jgi:ribosomal protein L19